jgi:hypothetical protein
MPYHGTLHILAYDTAVADSAPVFDVTFGRYDKDGAMRARRFYGWESLTQFLRLEIGVPEDSVKVAKDDLTRKRAASVWDLDIPDSKLERLRLI